MKASSLLHIVMALVFLCFGVATADPWKDESGHGRSSRSRHHYGKHDDRGRHDDNGRRARPPHKKEKKYHEHRGYHPRPHDRRRAYRHHEHRGRRYEYHGHWNSWEHWERYARRHPHMLAKGAYFRENAHLMFRFVDPVTGGFAFFSIGR